MINVVPRLNTNQNHMAGGLENPMIFPFCGNQKSGTGYITCSNVWGLEQEHTAFWCFFCKPYHSIKVYPYILKCIPPYSISFSISYPSCSHLIKTSYGELLHHKLFSPDHWIAVSSMLITLNIIFPIRFPLSSHDSLTIFPLDHG